MTTKTKKTIVGAAAIGGGLYLLFQFLPMLIAMTANILYLAVFLAVIALFIYGTISMIKRIK